MSSIKSLLFAALLLFSFSACNDHGSTEDNTAPVVIIEGPLTNEVIVGDVRIFGKVSDEDGLHEMSIVVINDDTAAEVFKSTPNVYNQQEYQFEETFNPSSLSGETSFTLTVTAEDHGGNVTTQSVKFKAKS